MKKYLFLFTISPVQAFISQARKAQDLFAGSQLLTDLTRFSIREFKQLTGNKPDIIFPAKWEPEHKAALPNRFLAEVESKTADAYTIGAELEKKVRRCFKQIAEDVFKKQARGQSKPAGFDGQIDNHLIIHWIFEDLSDKTYAKAYQEIESNLGAIKNIRHFNQLPDFEKGRKDSLTGELNALIFNKGGKPNAFTKNAVEISVGLVYLSNGEGLSAVGFTKRFYKLKENESFPSTAEIAQLDIKELIEKSAVFKLFKGLFKNDEDLDYQLLYKDNLNVKYFDKQGIEFPANDKSLLEFHKEIFKEVKDKGGKQKKYYAILIFDGDDMGKWLSGEKLKDANDETLKKYHHRFSELLADFAENAKNYVDNNNYGRTIYAGGDDFLAMLNLNKVFDVVEELRKKFDIEVSKVLKEEYPEIKEEVTFSAGLTIAHYQHPLGDALNTAREMEGKAKDNKAKDNKAKDSIAIAVLKKSGEQQKMVIKWGDNQVNIKHIQSIVEALKDKKVSPAFIENLNRVFQIMVDVKEPEKLFDIFKLETTTFLKRAKMPKTNNEDLNKIKDSITNLYNAMDLKNILETLNIIDFIYRKA